MQSTIRRQPSRVIPRRSPNNRPARQAQFGIAIALCLLFVAGCAKSPQTAAPSDAAKVVAAYETVAVASAGDAADDPAIWVNPRDPAASLVLGTDKQQGIYAYDLAGEVVQFLPVGRLNNVDLRQRVRLAGFTGDIAAASNRSDNTITLFSISPDGALTETGRIPSVDPEPYGLCLGAPTDGRLLAFLAQKTGDLITFEVDSAASGREIARIKLETQLEGCVFDDENDVLFVGEENRGIWRAAYGGGAFGDPELIDEVGRAGGLVADVEGLALYKRGGGDGYLIASSQGDNSYAVYARAAPHAFLGKFAIVAGTARTGAAIDGTLDTDGVEAVSSYLGPEFPEGLFVAQDGYIDGRREGQNFKLVDWRDIARALGVD